MQTLITGEKIITPDGVREDHSLIIEGDMITAITPGAQESSPDDHIIDARGMLVAPGMIDLHIHGSDGFWVMDANADSMHGMARFLAQHGVTSFLPTTISADGEAIMQVLASVRDATQDPLGAHFLGVHIEGPFLNPKNKGAQPEANLRAPDIAELKSWLATGVVRLVTLAPELEGAFQLIETAQAHDVEIAIGHSSASYEEIIQAVDHGLRQATHTFNSMAPLHHRRPGPIGAVLSEERIFAQVIVDGVHIHPAMVALLVRAKGPEKTILISDAISAAGRPDGVFDFSGHIVRVEDGIARINEGNLAGSTLIMDQAFRNVIRFCDLTLPQALPMATSSPAQAMGWIGRKGVLQAGADADVILLDENLQVAKTIVAGQLIFEPNAAADQEQVD